MKHMNKCIYKPQHQYLKITNRSLCVRKVVRACKYLFELNHYVFGQFHVLEHPLKLTGKCCSTFWKKVKNITYYDTHKCCFLPQLSYFPLCKGSKGLEKNVRGDNVVIPIPM